MDITKFNQFLNQISEVPLPVIEINIPLDSYISIDISENNSALLNFNISSSKEWQKYIDSYLSLHTKKVAFGGYLEKRNIYDRSDYFINIAAVDKRNIHLGTDLWCRAATNVLAVLDGEVHSFKNNNNYGDYGPTIILKHYVGVEVFYTLYGHLSLDSIQNLDIGTTVKQGQVISSLGKANVNGDYAPHLHFQIIRNLAENFGDYPGVASENDIKFYKGNCPNPNYLLKLEIEE
jgi:murein DD-endopeptidase MepM/ murein hydrolase activator NlpD